jgi:hypothetical protein
LPVLREPAPGGSRANGRGYAWTCNEAATDLSACEETHVDWKRYRREELPKINKDWTRVKDKEEDQLVEAAFGEKITNFVDKFCRAILSFAVVYLIMHVLFMVLR